MVQVRKKFIIVDISGKVDKYDKALANSLTNVSMSGSISLLYPGHGLISLVPQRFKNSGNIVKRLVKVVEGGINYTYLIGLCATKHVDVLHFQWLPFMEVNGFEIPVLKLIRTLSPSTKMILTIHNLFPHNLRDDGKPSYSKRFCRVSTFFDEFIVHTQSTKNDVIREFTLPQDHIHVCAHGVFAPSGVVPEKTNREGGKLRVLLFGNQSRYKGTDILVDAVSRLDEAHGSKVDVRIIGEITPSFLAEMKDRDIHGRIRWSPHFIDNKSLFNEINSCDLIVLPYREISQSGVLLLSLYFEKLIVCSDLPSFVETMRGDEGEELDDDLFFESGNPVSLCKLLSRYIDNATDEIAIHHRLSVLKEKYSWDSSAKATLDVYC